MESGSPLVPLLGTTIALLGLIGVLVFAVMKLRGARKEESAPDRLSEEAFAAATIQAALASRPGGGAVGGPLASSAVALDAAVLETLPAAIVATDDAGVIRRINAAARARLGLTAASTGHPHRTVLARWPMLAEAFARAHATGEAIDPVLVPLDDGVVTALVGRWPQAGARGGVMALLVPEPGDVPAQGAAPVSAAATDEVSRLASGLAHELANSLTTVHGYVHLMDRSALTETDRTAIEQISASAEMMLRTVEAFRALVRPLRLSPVAFAPAAAVEAAITLARQETGAAAEAVQLDRRPCATVTGDQVVLEEAIAAVVANAIEASRQRTPAPPVAVRVGPAAGGGVEIVVADAGPGVPDDVRRRLGQPFFSDKPGHSGLGLARALHAIRAHDGASLTLSHPATGGLTATIALPASR